MVRHNEIACLALANGTFVESRTSSVARIMCCPSKQKHGIIFKIAIPEEKRVTNWQNFVIASGISGGRKL